MKKTIAIVLTALSLASAILVTGCEKFEPGTSIFGKWECSDNRQFGWQIEYRRDNTYSVTFNSGDPAWEGKYVRDDSAITYTPNDARQSSSNYLRTSLSYVSRNAEKAILLGATSATTPDRCDRVGL